MRYIVLIALCFGLVGSLGLSHVQAHAGHSHTLAQDSGTTAEVSQATDSGQPLEYVLPFPGILPTHPLYFLKNLRDKIIESLVVDPVNKSEFYVLQADKKLGMAIALKDQGKESESKQVLVDALQARKNAIASLESAKNLNREIPRYVVEKLSLSLGKHEEVLSTMGEDPATVTGLHSQVDAIMPAAK